MKSILSVSKRRLPLVLTLVVTLALALSLGRDVNLARRSRTHALRFSASNASAQR